LLSSQIELLFSSRSGSHFLGNIMTLLPPPVFIGRILKISSHPFFSHLDFFKFVSVYSIDRCSKPI